MISIKVPMEIQNYKEKFFLGLNKRQLGSLAVALVINVPLIVFGQKYMSLDTLIWIALLVAAPCFCFGWFKFYDMNFEEFAKKFISFNFNPQKRKYVELNVFWETSEEVRQDEVNKQLRRKEQLQTRAKQKKGKK